MFSLSPSLSLSLSLSRYYFFSHFDDQLNERFVSSDDEKRAVAFPPLGFIKYKNIVFFSIVALDLYSFSRKVVRSPCI